VAAFQRGPKKQEGIAMNDETALDELVSLWECERVQGRDVAASELCRDRPELRPELERRIRAVRQMGALVQGDTVTCTSNTGETPSTRGTDTSPRLPSPPGYEIVAELGRGGMGVVYKARQISLNRTVALKMLLAGPHASAKDTARFLHEAHTIAGLKHPHVVQVYDFGSHEGKPFMSLEYLEGGSLADKLRGEPQPPAQAARTVQTLAQAVQAAHEKGIVHRDLKPANVLLAADGTLKVTKREKGSG
jgi:serine/threonine protein kinase